MLARLALTLGVCFALMTSGCADGSGDKQVQPERVAETPTRPAKRIAARPPVRTPIDDACREVNDELRKEIESTVTIPGPDVYDEQGMPWLSNSAIKGWIAMLEDSEREKAKAARVLLESYEKCRSFVSGQRIG